MKQIILILVSTNFYVKSHRAPAHFLHTNMYTYVSALFSLTHNKILSKLNSKK